MKHPFYTLYYSGLAILFTVILVIGLFGANMSNLLSIFSKDNPEPAPYNKEIDTKIFKDFPVGEVKPDKLPIKPKVEIVIKENPTPTRESFVPKPDTTLEDIPKEDATQVIDSLKKTP
jgi:hypothetical protein